MFGPSKANRALQEQVFQLEAVVAAIHRSQAVIEFSLDGTILDANDNFLQVLDLAWLVPEAVAEAA